MVEQQPIPEIEKRFLAVKGGIITALKERGGDPENKLRRFGFETIGVIRRDLEENCSQALCLSADGSWSIRNVDIGIWGYSLGGKSSFNNLVAEYAQLKDPQGIELMDHFADEEDPDKGLEWSNKFDEYVLLNRDRLAQNFVEALELTLANLR